jgi:hypothetical protein
MRGFVRSFFAQSDQFAVCMAGSLHPGKAQKLPAVSQKRAVPPQKMRIVFIIKGGLGYGGTF